MWWLMFIDLDFTMATKFLSGFFFFQRMGRQILLNEEKLHYNTLCQQGRQ